MELRTLRYFLAVAEALNFNRAARQLNIAQPALSQQIRQLEAELGVTLIDRSRRQIQLTLAGQILKEDAGKLLGGAEMVIRTVRRAARGEIGRLVIGFVPGTSWLIPGIVNSFRASYPAVDLDFEELAGDDPFQALAKETIDLAIMLEGAEGKENIASRLLNRAPLVLAIPQTNPLATSNDQRVSWEELAGENLVMFARKIQPRLYDRFIDKLRATGLNPAIVKEVSQLETAFNLVAAGRGIAPVSGYLADRLRWQGVAFKAIEEPGLDFEIFAVWRQEDSSPVLQNFLAQQ